MADHGAPFTSDTLFGSAPIHGGEEGFCSMRTMDRVSRVMLSVLIGASVVAGCGDDDDSGGDVTTGIAPSKLLSDVTEEEAASACTRLQAGFERVFDRDKLIDAICTIGAAAFADTSADCEMIRDQCI